MGVGVGSGVGVGTGEGVGGVSPYERFGIIVGSLLSLSGIVVSDCSFVPADSVADGASVLSEAGCTVSEEVSPKASSPLTGKVGTGLAVGRPVYTMPLSSRCMPKLRMAK